MRHHDKYAPRDDHENAAWEELERLVVGRPEYAATPLNSYSLKEDGEPYIQGAIDYVNGKFAANLAALPEAPSEPVTELLVASINAAVFNRVHENIGKTIPADTDEATAEIFARACKGFAGPDELLTLLSRYPHHLKSLELAKLTHPFDWKATEEMDVAIDDTLTNAGFSMRGGTRTQNVRYYYLRADNPDNPQAMMFVRKADIGVRQADGGSIMVVKRDSLVVDIADESMTAVADEARKWLKADETQRMIKGGSKVRYTKPRFVTFMDEQLETCADSRSASLYPGVRSYYAHYESTLD